MSIASELSETKPDSLSFLHGVKDCIPTLLGYVCIGFAAGIVGASSGVSTMEIAFMSALVYAGASQFIMCSMLAASSPPSVIILTTFIVNARHLLLSASLAPYFSKYSLWKNIGIGALLTDESFGVASDKLAKGGQVSDRWMNGLNITAYLAWIASCVAGGFSGTGFPGRRLLVWTLPCLRCSLPCLFPSSKVSRPPNSSIACCLCYVWLF